MDLTKQGFDLFLDPAPPNLAKAFGYSGDRRWVAFFWSKENDIFFSYDGTRINTISYIAWSGLLEHPYTISLQRQKTVSYEYGDFYQEAKHWLLLDRKSQILYTGRRDQVIKYLRENDNPVVTPKIEPSPNWSLNPLAGELYQVECMACWLDEKLQEAKNNAFPKPPPDAATVGSFRLLFRSSR